MNDATSNLPQPPQSTTFDPPRAQFAFHLASPMTCVHKSPRMQILTLRALVHFLRWSHVSRIIRRWTSFYSTSFFVFLLRSLCAALSRLKLNENDGEKIFLSTRFFFFLISPKEKSEKLFQKIFYYTKKAIFFPWRRWCCESIFGWIISLSFRARSWDVIWAFYCLPDGKILAFGDSNSLPQCIVVVDSNHPDLYWLSRCHLGDVVTCRFWGAFKWLIPSSAQNASLSDLLGWCFEGEISVTRCFRSWLISPLSGEWQRIFHQKRDENGINCHYGELLAAFPITSIWRGPITAGGTVKMGKLMVDGRIC